MGFSVSQLIHGRQLFIHTVIGYIQQQNTGLGMFIYVSFKSHLGTKVLM